MSEETMEQDAKKHDGGKIRVTAVFARPDSQIVKSLSLPEGTTLGEAVEKSDLMSFVPAEDKDSVKFGIWGRVKGKSEILHDGDRVEIYRPITCDPRAVRKSR